MNVKRKSNKRIYLDFAAATPLCNEAKKAMDRYFSADFANASGGHEEGRAAASALEGARSEVAAALSARLEEVTFVSGATEANNMALLGVLGAKGKEKMHVIISAIEHPSLYACANKLKTDGMQVTILGVTKEGRVDLKKLEKALLPETVLVSVMYVNNEIGTIGPIAEIAKFIKRRRERLGSGTPYFHTDASQAPLYLSCDVGALGVDLLTLDGGKFYGPKGVGVLYHKKGVPLTSLFCGGGQEKGLRAGTENVALAVGFARAFTLAQEEYKERSERVGGIRDFLFEEIQKYVPDVIVNGSKTQRIANNLNVSIHGADAEYLVAYLDAHGVAASSKSACLSADDESSYVLEAIDGPKEGGVRFSLGAETTVSEMRIAARVFREAVEVARRAPKI